MSGALPTQEDTDSEDGREEKEESASTTDKKENSDKDDSKKEQQEQNEKKGEEWALEKRDDDARSEASSRSSRSSQHSSSGSKSHNSSHSNRSTNVRPVLPSSRVICINATQEIPPIVTFPEKLLPQSQHTPPVKPSTLISAIYAASAVSLVTYAANNFVFQPMYSSLTDARSQLFATTKAGLDGMNERLRDLVTPTPPETIIEKALPVPEPVTTAEEGDNFLVSRGCQTEENPIDSAMRQANSDNKLAALSATLSSFLDDVETEAHPEEVALSGALDDLETYLEGLRYNTTPFGVAVDAEQDLFGKVKSEIRGVKGVLLNSRNFPTSSK